ncbi:uncharacterized protein A4U43_C05F3190 [Asparagus officinalis]|uniref:Plastocyanin-like domain-containing protein n=1 Tax=Asparagus officinalis TaxID=4686 RepID=A0A5P1EPL4_ASPOF|nr:uncharacterized protein A4U43_C05F3190 [Asparagus officinalis]
MQDTGVLGVESHPLHLHGFNFVVVGQGFGNYDSHGDPPKFNLVDPIKRNTIGVPSRGWTAIMFRTDNPGVFGSCIVTLRDSHKLRIEDGLAGVGWKAS